MVIGVLHAHAKFVVGKGVCFLAKWFSIRLQVLAKFLREQLREVGAIRVALDLAIGQVAHMNVWQALPHGLESFAQLPMDQEGLRKAVERLDVLRAIKECRRDRVALLQLHATRQVTTLVGWNTILLEIKRSLHRVVDKVGPRG